MRALRMGWLALVLMQAAPAFAEDAAPGDIRGTLKAQVGKTATVQMRSGQELTGTVSFVGDEVVRLSKLSGRDFYDAAVKLDDVSAVVIKAR